MTFRCKYKHKAVFNKNQPARRDTGMIEINIEYPA
jgi:hypothetical protein